MPLEFFSLTHRRKFTLNCLLFCEFFYTLITNSVYKFIVCYHIQKKTHLELDSTLDQIGPLQPSTNGPLHLPASLVLSSIKL